MSLPEFLVVLITTPDKKVAEHLSKVLVESKTAACVNIIPQVQSIFHWQGTLSGEEESLLIVKARANAFDEELVPLVTEHHPYEIPEIIAIPIIQGSRPYLAWMEDETG